MSNILRIFFLLLGFHLYSQTPDSTIYEITPFPGHYSNGRMELLRELSEPMNEVKIENIDSISGRIIAQFVLEPDSTISNLEIHKSPDAGLSEAISNYLYKP